MPNFTHFSHNGRIMPLNEAVVPLSSVEYSYGFGVYETIRVSKANPYFLDEHCVRLMASAATISLEHQFTQENVHKAAIDLIAKNEVDACNLKILLIGAPSSESADLYMLCLNPLFPDRKLYKTGVHCITQNVERPFPQAKTLNMLPGYLAFRAAKQAGAYDALCINRHGCITEGTRTNFFVLKDRTIISPPAAEILPGVTRTHVLEVAEQNNFEIIEQEIKLADVARYDGAFLTSTSSKIMPIRSIDDHTWESVPEPLRELMVAFDRMMSTA